MLLSSSVKENSFRCWCDLPIILMGIFSRLELNLKKNSRSFEMKASLKKAQSKRQNINLKLKEEEGNLLFFDKMGTDMKKISFLLHMKIENPEKS